MIPDRVSSREWVDLSGDIPDEAGFVADFLLLVFGTAHGAAPLSCGSLHSTRV
jgi:hypothetical protein